MTRAHLVDSRFAGLRTNLAGGPNAINASQPGWTSSRWFGSGATPGTHTRLLDQNDGPVPQLRSYIRKQWTGTAPAGNGDTGFDNGFLAGIVPGNTYSFSSYLRSSAAGKSGVRMTVQWQDAASVNIGTATGGLALTLVAGAWTRLTFTGVAPALAAKAWVLSEVDSGTPWAVNDILDGTGLLIEVGALRPYFDGSFRNAKWTGVVNSSTSIGYGFVGLI